MAVGEQNRATAGVVGECAQGIQQYGVGGVVLGVHTGLTHPPPPPRSVLDHRRLHVFLSHERVLVLLYTSAAFLLGV